jgi:hypothetical protein
LVFKVFNRKPWLIAVIGVSILLLVGYAKRGALERTVIGWKLYDSHVFTPPTLHGESAWSRVTESARFYWDFAGFVMAWGQRLREFKPILRPLVKEIVRRQSAGEGMQYSMHIYREIRWRLNFTPDTKATWAEIAELRHSLALPASEQELATQQQPSDGSWGLGFTAWYLRFYYSVPRVKQCQSNPRYPFSFLGRINSPEKLTGVLNTDLMDNFAKTGEFNEEQLNETFSALARILFATRPTDCYTFHPGLRAALRQFVVRWQNPVTGCWGQWLVDRQGRIWKMDDISMTFHVVSDLHGQLPHLDLIAKRLLELDEVAFPAGLRVNGHYENHLNWDAVKIFRYAWPTLDNATRQRVRAEISRMLHWCLTKSYQPDGSFKVSDLDDTLGDAYEYGVDFLQEAGYFNRANRFWTTQDFPDAKSVHDRIESKLKQLGLHDPGLKDAYETLESRQ